jgi:hypothetical protein
MDHDCLFCGGMLYELFPGEGRDGGIDDTHRCAKCHAEGPLSLLSDRLNNWDNAPKKK